MYSETFRLSQKGNLLTYYLGGWYKELDTSKQKEELDTLTHSIKTELDNLSMHRYTVIGRKVGSIEVRKKDGFLS